MKSDFSFIKYAEILRIFMKILFKTDKKAYGCFPDFVKIFVPSDNGFIRAKNVPQRNSLSETEFLKN